MIRHILIATAVGLGAGCSNLSQVMDTGGQVSQAAGYNPAQLATGVKDALVLSVTRASEQLSTEGGYSDSIYRLQLPQEVEQVSAVLSKFGLGGQVSKVEQLMNKGAEIAAGEAQAMFLDAVRDMSINDALGIIRGGDTAATDYFRAQTEATLQQRYQTIMQNQLKQVGFYTQYQQFLSAYKLLPVADKPDLDIEQAAVRQGIEGMFKQIAKEESAIRQNPVEQGSLLIGSIFGGKN